MPTRNSKRVLFVSQSLFGGGAERAVVYFCKLLSERGWNVHLLILQNKTQEYDVPESVVLHRPGSEVLGMGSKIRYIRRVVREIQPLRVIAFLYEPMICSYLATRGIICEFWTAVRNNPDRYPKGKLRRTISKLLFRASDLCLLQTEGQAPLIGFSHKSDYAVVPNAVGTRFLKAEHRYSDNPNRIIAVGRLEEQKNYPLLLQAFELLAREDPRCVLDIYGEGSLRSELESWIASHEMSDKVVLHGAVSDIEKGLSNADIYVSTSRYEGMPNSLMEAMAVGLPCVAVDCKTGPSDLIDDGVNGYLVPDGADCEMVASCLLECLKEPQKMRTMGEHARKTVEENYTERVIQQQLISLFENGVSSC